jgi:hypothetical protein
MSPADIIGAAQLFVAVMQLQLQIWMTPATPARLYERTTDRRFELGTLKIRSRTKTARRQ